MENNWNNGIAHCTQRKYQILLFASMLVWYWIVIGLLLFSHSNFNSLHAIWTFPGLSGPMSWMNRILYCEYISQIEKSNCLHFINCQRIKKVSITHTHTHHNRINYCHASGNCASGINDSVGNHELISMIDGQFEIIFCRNNKWLTESCVLFQWLHGPLLHSHRSSAPRCAWKKKPFPSMAQWCAFKIQEFSLTVFNFNFIIGIHNIEMLLRHNVYALAIINWYSQYV